MSFDKRKVLTVRTQKGVPGHRKGALKISFNYVIVKKCFFWISMNFQLLPDLLGNQSWKPRNKRKRMGSQKDSKRIKDEKGRMTDFSLWRIFHIFLDIRPLPFWVSLYAPAWNEWHRVYQKSCPILFLQISYGQELTYYAEKNSARPSAKSVCVKWAHRLQVF